MKQNIFLVTLTVLLINGFSVNGQNSGLLQIDTTRIRKISVEELNNLSPLRTDYISLEFYHSLRIPDNHISIKIRNSNGKDVFLSFSSEPIKEYREKFRHTIIDTTFKITYADYHKAVQLFKEISSSDIFDFNSSPGLVSDGTRCKLEFGNFTNSVTYSVWSPDYKAEERKLLQFLECYEHIKQLAKKPF